MTQLAMGSVAERVVRTAPCPVLLVQPAANTLVMQETLAATATA
jgi:hypothetical protein